MYLCCTSTNLTYMTAKKIKARVLLVEDDLDDVFLVEQSLKKNDFAVDMHHVPNGKACLDYLYEMSETNPEEMPDVVLLDLNMPVLDGRETMAKIAVDKRLKHLPVLVLTTSTDEEEVLKMYQLRCSSYIQKSLDFTEFHKKIQEITHYWFNSVVLPARRDQS